MGDELADALERQPLVDLALIDEADGLPVGRAATAAAALALVADVGLDLLAQRRREQGAVRLTFTCNENGKIGDIAVVGSSRSLTLDQAATRFLANQSCVKAAGTFDATYGFELPDD